MSTPPCTLTYIRYGTVWRTFSTHLNLVPPICTFLACFSKTKILFIYFFYVSLTVQLSITLANNQPDAQIF
jgi:hypothetical protein